MSKKHKKIFPTLNCFVNLSQFLELLDVLQFLLLSLSGISIRITSYVIKLKMCTIAEGVKIYKSIIKEKKKKHDEIKLLAKSKLNCIELFNSKALIGSIISHDELVLKNNVSKEYNDMKEEIKNLNT